MVFSCARAAGSVPSRVIVVANEPVRLVFTAFMTIVFPSAVRLTVASSTGTFEPWAEVLTSDCLPYSPGARRRDGRYKADSRDTEA